MPLNQDITQRHAKRQMGLKRLPEAMAHLCELADHRHHRQDGFNDHPHIPVPARTDVQIHGISLFSMKPGIAQDDHLVFTRVNQGLKGRIGTLAVSQPQATTSPHWFSSRHNVPPTIQR